MQVVKENVPKIFRELLTEENFSKNNNCFSYYFEAQNNKGIYFKIHFMMNERPNNKLISVAFVCHTPEVSDDVVSHDNTFTMDDDDIYDYITKYINFYMGVDYCQCGKISYSFNQYCNNCMLTHKLIDDPCIICMELLIDDEKYYKNCCDKCNTLIHYRCYQKNNGKCPICRD